MAGSSDAASGVAPGDPSVSVVRMRVDQAVQGVHAGEIFNLTQWRGATALALFPHQRVILFLHQPNAAGISSSVSGNFGLLSIGGGGLVPLRGLELLGAQRALSTGGLPRPEADAEASMWTTRKQCPQPGSPARIELRTSIMSQKATQPCVAAGPPGKTGGLAIDAETMPAAQLLRMVVALVRKGHARVVQESLELDDVY